MNCGWTYCYNDRSTALTLLVRRIIRQQTVQSNALTFICGSSPCGCISDLRAAWFNHFLLLSLKRRKINKLFLPSFISFVYDLRLAAQFKEICNLSLRKCAMSTNRTEWIKAHCMNWSPCKINVTGHLILTRLYKR